MKNIFTPKPFAFSFFIFLLSFSAFSQDIHFSQFYASPLTLNAAQTGNYRGDWRIMNNFRSQWKAIGIPFRTISLGADRQFYLGKERLSGGLIVVSDQSGDSKLNVTKLYASASYHKYIGKSIFHIGIQPGYVTKTFNTSKLTFPNQFDMKTGQFSIDAAPNNEASLGNDAKYFDLNSGIVWTGLFGKFQPELGFSIFHITRPKETFLKKDNNLPMRQAFHAGGKLDLTEKFFLMPNVLYMTHNKASDMLAGANLGIKIKENQAKIKSVFAGPLFRSGIGRNADALIAIAGVNFMQLDVGISYDVNISSLKAATRNRGAFEFSIIYTGMDTRISKVTLPCDRY